MPGQSTPAIARSPLAASLNARAVAFCAVAAHLAGAIVALCGSIGLLGWILDNQALKALYTSHITMKANTAACLLLAGSALLILGGERRPSPWFHVIGHVLGVIVSVVGAMTLVEHLWGINLGIDELMFRETPGAAATASPGRMGPPASISFLVGGIALALLDWRTRRGRVASQHLALLVGLIALLPLVGYAYIVEPLYGISKYTGIAVHTALAIGALALGILAARPRSGLMAVICANDSGGMMARRLLVAAVLIPFLLGWMGTHAEHAGIFDDAFGRPLLILALIVSFTTLLWWNARATSRVERDRAVALAEKSSAMMRIAADQETMARERRRLIEELQERAEELAAASAAKDRFLAVLSHELRTPLTPVLLSVSLMEASPELPGSLREDLAAIRRNVELESQLISDLLDLTRIAKGKLQLQSQDVDLHQTLRAAIDICRYEASANLIVDLAATRHIVRGDQTRLQQVFWNLIGNAQKFTPAQGAIFIRSIDAPNGNVRVEIKDTGAGIDPEVLPKLFYAFEQGAARSDRPQAGLGLGLAISKSVVEAHGGRISAASEGRGKGSKFVIDLPAVQRARAASTTPAEPAAQPARLPQLSILLVEDHEPTLRAMAKLLERMGHRITTANTAASAIAAAHADSLDLLVCDLGLPDGSGLEVMRRVRPKFAGRAIALTGYGMESDIQASLDAGFTEHLTKPVDSVVLQAALRRVAGMNRTN